MQYTITLADGRKLTGLTKNGDNFVSKTKVDESIFVNNLSTMKVSDGETEITMTDVQFIQQMEWVDGNIGSKLTMKYPACILKGEGARGMTLSIAIAGKGQHQDAGAKMMHLAPNTSSTIVSKSISKQGGKVTYRGIVHFGKKADGARSNIECDTLIMDNESTSDTIPYNEIHNDNISLEHEAKVSKVSEEQLFYLMSRGISEQEATEMIVMGFIEPFTKELPMEYAVEMNRLISFEMEGSIG